MIKFAQFLSHIFNPVVFLLITPFVIVYKFTSNPAYAAKWFIFSALFIFIGTLLLLVGRIRGIFSDIDVSKRKERTNLYLMLYLLSLVYFVAAIFFKGISFPLSIVSFSIVLSILLFNIINHFMKISIHTSVASGFVTAITIIFGIEGLISTILIIPLITWSRIVLKRHTLKEALLGAVFGILITFSTFILGRFMLYN